MLKWLAAFLALWFIYEVRSVFPPFVVGAIIAYLLLPLVQQVSVSAKIRASLAVAVLYLVIAGVTVLLGWAFMPTLSNQVQELISNRGEIVANVIRQADSTFRWQINVDDVTSQVLTSIEASIGQPSELAHIGGVVSHSLLSLLVCIVSSIYFIVDSQRVGDFGLRFVPEEKHEIVRNLSRQMNRMLARYVRGQLVLILFMSTVAWTFLHYAIHMKYALPIAILSGFLEIIPVLGPILATSIATLVGFAQYDVQHALIIIAFYTLARWLEDYLVVPRVIGHAVDLHPLIVIFAVLCGEVIAGALGMLIAIPVAASIKVIVDFLYPPEAKVAEPARGRPESVAAEPQAKPD